MIKIRGRLEAVFGKKQDTPLKNRPLPHIHHPHLSGPVLAQNTKEIKLFGVNLSLIDGGLWGNFFFLESPQKKSLNFYYQQCVPLD